MIEASLVDGQQSVSQIFIKLGYANMFYIIVFCLWF